MNAKRNPLSASKKLVVTGLALMFFLGPMSGHATDGAGAQQRISIRWPKGGELFTAATSILISPDISRAKDIARVRFYAGTNLIGVATNAPFNAVWDVPVENFASYGIWDLRAVANDISGVELVSEPVRIRYYTGGVPSPILSIIAPPDGAVLPALSNFTFTAELLASAGGDAGPVDFFVGTNFVGRVTRDSRFQADTPPYSLTVTNLAEGVYELRAKYQGANAPYCRCQPIRVTITRLGLTGPAKTPDQRFESQAICMFTEGRCVIEASSDLRSWVPIQTNSAQGTLFRFSDSQAPGFPRRFYRLMRP